MDKLDWNDNNLVQMLNGLHPNDYQKTVRNCKINDFVDADLVDADQYEIHWDEEAGIRHPKSTDTTISLSLKIAIMTNPQGQLAGVVTFHLSGSPW